MPSSSPLPPSQLAPNAAEAPSASAVTDAVTEGDTDAVTEGDTKSESGPSDDARNLAALATQQVLVRTGWIFKTESIIMPAVIDLLGGGAWVRACLPVLNRFGLSVPPLLLARRLHVTRRKAPALAGATALMALSFAALSLAWRFREALGGWMTGVFLLLYTLFFISTGLHQLAFGTLSGKLVAPERRGRLMSISNGIGATVAISCALLLLKPWLQMEEQGGPGVVWIFGFSALCFATAALSALWLRESPDAYQSPRKRIGETFGQAWQLLRSDRNFRRLSLVAALFGFSFTLFPHYQAIAIGEVGLGFDQMMFWVVVQNAGTGVFSLFVGPAADARGNRFVLRACLALLVSGPLLALALSHGSGGSRYFPVVFLMIGLTPVTLRVLQNYTLEIAPRESHPLYLSTLSLSVAAPVFLSLLMGLLIDATGFAVVFCVVAGLLSGAWLLAFGLEEPRHAPS